MPDTHNVGASSGGEADASRPIDKLEEVEGVTPGGLPPEDVEDRPGVGSVKPEDYPKDLPDH